NKLTTFQVDMEAFLIGSGWSFVAFSPERRSGRDRRSFPRISDRRRWWTDGSSEPPKDSGGEGRWAVCRVGGGLTDPIGPSVPHPSGPAGKPVRSDKRWQLRTPDPLYFLLVFASNQLFRGPSRMRKRTLPGLIAAAMACSIGLAAQTKPAPQKAAPAT